MAILDRSALAAALNRQDLRDPLKYADPYIALVIADVQASIASYLRFDPVLQVIAGEEGPAELDGTGSYRGLYRIQLDHAPLVPGPASGIFTSLQVTYARSAQVTIPADLAYCTIAHATGRVFLSPGALGALAGIGFDLGGPFGYPQADGYVASYAAGYATGIGDPLLPGGGSYGAPPMPADITQAAVLLCRERLAMDDAANASTTSTSAGDVMMVKSGDQTIQYRSTQSSSTTAAPAALGAGTAMALAAMRRLAPYRRTQIA